MAAMSTIALVAAGAAAGTAISALTKPKTPKAPETVDPAIERAKAETEAAQASNSKLAARNKARQASSLLAKDQDSIAAAGGKTLLGQ